MATLQQLRVRASTLLDQPLVGADVPAAGVFWTQSNLNDFINEGYLQVYAEIAEIEGPTLAAEVTGTYASGSRSLAINNAAFFNLAADPLKILGMHDITGDAAGVGSKIPYVPYNQFDALRSTSASGTALTTGGGAWTWWGTNPMNISLFPRPGGARTLRMRYIPAEPTALVDPNAPVGIPVAHHYILSYYAAMRAMQKEENNSYAMLRDTYLEHLTRLKNSVEERQSAESRHVFVSGGTEYGGRW